jgi:hypothetical protein
VADYLAMRLYIGWLSVCWVACAGVPSDADAGLLRPDAGAVDGGLPVFDGGADAGSLVDAGSIDAGLPDGGRPDAGSSPFDGGRWVRLTPLPAPQQESGVAAVDGRVYIVGGLGPGFALMAEVNRYTPDSGQWAAVRPLPRPLHHLNVAGVAGKLYSVGCLEGGGFAARGDTLEYDPVADQWTARAPMPAGAERGGSAVGVIGGEIFVAGGFRGGSAVTQFSAYDPAANRHRMLPPLPMATEHVVGGAVGTRFFVIGGRNGGTDNITNRVQIFDTASGAWVMGPDLPTARGGHAAAIIGTRIVVMGGEGNPAVGTGVFAQTEVLDTVTMRWFSGATMLTPRHGIGAASVGDWVYVPGGGTSEGLAPVAVVEAFAP